MKKCDGCVSQGSCSFDRQYECYMGDNLYYIPESSVPDHPKTKLGLFGEYIGRCDNCGCNLYSDDERYRVTLGNSTFVFCRDCCAREF